jgi:hypothetical protein
MNRWHVLCLTLALLGQIAFGKEDLQAVSMSSKDFLQRPFADQRDLLVAVFERRLEHSKNLSYDADLALDICVNLEGKPGELKETCSFRRWHSWQLGDSYRVDADMFLPNQLEKAVLWTSSGFNAEEGVGRCTVKGTDNRTAGRIDTVHNQGLEDNHYSYWLDGMDRRKQEYLFRDILAHQQDFEIQAADDPDLVQLTIDYQPYWTNKPGGKRVFLLDPRKGFLPIQGESRWDETSAKGRHRWRIERFVVKES